MLNPFFKKIVTVILFIVSSAAIAKVNVQANLQELDTRGFTVVRNVFTAEQIKLLRDAYLQCKTQAFAIIDNIPAQPRFFSENDGNNQSKYWKTAQYTILQAGKGRYDFYQGFDNGILASDIVKHNPILEKLMLAIMKDEITNYSGIIHSEPGSEDQYWHRDTHTLANVGTDGSKLVIHDDFYFTILVPLTVDFTIENGTTEFLEGSHRLAAKDFGNCKPVQVPVPLGSALVFNGKINHRGKANLSKDDRPALYIVYHKKWYNDQYRSGIN
jgi:hypothetical protein